MKVTNRYSVTDTDTDTDIGTDTVLMFDSLFSAINRVDLWVEHSDLDCLPFPLRQETCRKLKALRDRLFPGTIWCWGTFAVRVGKEEKMKINGYLHKDRLLAIHKEQGIGAWAISHIPTGYKLLGGLTTLKRAKTCVRSLLEPQRGGRELLGFCDEKPPAHENSLRLVDLLKKCLKEAS